MKKFVVAVLLGVISFTGCGKSKSGSGQSSVSASVETSIQRPDVDLFIGTDEWPPYEGTNGEKVSGFSVELISKVLDGMGKSYKIQVFPWKRGTAMVFDGKLDALFSASHKVEREEKCYYPTENILMSRYVFFIRKSNMDTLKYNSFEDLLGHKVGVSSGYSYNEDFWNFVKTNQIYDEGNSDTVNFKKLARGRIDYFPCELGNGISLIKELGLTNDITYLSKTLIQKPYYIIFSKKTVKEEFVKKYSEALHKFKQTEDYKRLYNSYFK